MIAFGEFAPDVADYNVEVARVADNCLPGPNGYKPLGALSEFTPYGPYGGTTNVTATAAYTYSKGNVSATDTVDLLLEKNATIQFYINGGTSVGSPVAASARTSVAANYWDFIQWENRVLVFGDIATPLYWDGISSTMFTIGGSPPEMSTAAKVRQFVVGGNVTGGASMVQWSAFDDFEGWTAGTDQSGSADLTGGGKVVRIVGGEYGVVFQQNAITRMNYVGTPGVWEFDPIVSALGARSPGGVVQVGVDIYFLSNSGFYVLKDGSTPISIGENKVDRWFLDAVESLGEGNISGAYDPANDVVAWAFSESTGTDEKDRVIFYHIPTQRWSTATANTYSLFTTAKQFNEPQVSNLGAIHWNGTKISTYVFNGTAAAATLETGHIFTEGAKTSVSSVRPVIDGTCTVALITKDNALTDADAETSAESLDADGKADFRSNARYHRIKCVTSGAFTNAAGVEVDQHQDGNR